VTAVSSARELVSRGTVVAWAGRVTVTATAAQIAAGQTAPGGPPASSRPAVALTVMACARYPCHSAAPGPLLRPPALRADSGPPLR
jgi:hypothetical protein